jgi:hypothetical protein
VHAGVGQHEVVGYLEERQLLRQSRCVFAQRVDPPTNRRHRLTKVAMQALDKSAIDLPTPLGQNRLKGRCRAEDDAGLNPDDAPATVELDHLCLEPLGGGHPAPCGLGPFVMAAFGLSPVAIRRDPCGERLATPIRQKQRGAMRRQHLGDPLDQALGLWPGSDLPRQRPG